MAGVVPMGQTPSEVVLPRTTNLAHCRRHGPRTVEPAPHELPLSSSSAPHGTYAHTSHPLRHRTAHNRRFFGFSFGFAADIMTSPRFPRKLFTTILVQWCGAKRMVTALHVSLRGRMYIVAECSQKTAYWL